MYLNFFGLKEEPFSIAPNPKFIYWSTQHEKATESLLYGITQRKGFSLLTGEVGTGKTTLCREIVNRLDKNTQTSMIFNPLLSVAGLLKAINHDFGKKTRSKSAEDQLNSLNNFLISKAQSNKNAVVMIDEAQNLSFEALEMVRLLSNLETDSQKLLQIVLIGQPELEKTLSQYSLRQLNQRIAVRQKLTALKFDEYESYINFRLLNAGARGRIDFDKAALKSIFKYTQGFPRLTNILCDRALLAAFAHKKNKINKSLIKESVKDLGWSKPNKFSWFSGGLK